MFDKLKKVKELRKLGRCFLIAREFLQLFQLGLLDCNDSVVHRSRLELFSFCMQVPFVHTSAHVQKALNLLCAGTLNLHKQLSLQVQGLHSPYYVFPMVRNHHIHCNIHLLSNQQNNRKDGGQWLQPMEFKSY